MKNILKLSALFTMLCLLGLAGCTEELSTDQFDDDTVMLSAFAPNPVVRGAELRIMGSNLDRIVEVQVPGAEPIKDIEVVSTGRISEIRVVIPSAGAEEESVSGPVVIIDKSGKTYQSKDDLTFKEGIVFDSFSPQNAMPGAVITVKGDYLYSVQQVVLNDNVYVTGDQILEKSRRELKFVVPSNAVTGPVTVGDVNEKDNSDGKVPNNIPSSEELVIGSPTVKSADRGLLKAGATIRVEGEYLDMIKSVSIGGKTVEFVLAEDHKSLALVLPDSVKDGDVVLVSYAGEEFNAGSYTTVVPSQLTIKAETRYKAGLNVVVAGKDLDLVTGAELAGTALEYTNAEGKITFAIPATAKDGTVKFTLANGKTVETEAIELVKPAVAQMTPSELYAGDSFEITGTDLDLITSVTIKSGDRKDVLEYKCDDEGTKITVPTLADSVTGEVELATANETTIQAGTLTVKYDSYVVVTSLPSDARIGDEVTMKGSNFNMIEAIYFGDVKVTGYSKRASDEMVFVIPEAVATGTYNIKFVLTTGEEETCASVINVMGAMTTVEVFSGSFDLGDWGPALKVEPAQLAKLPFGATLHFEFEVLENPEKNWYQFKLCCNNPWTDLLPSVISVKPGETHYSLVLSDENMSLIAKGALAIQGVRVVMKRVYFTYENAGPDPIFVTDVMINDYEQHGGHNGGWDNSWGKDVATGAESYGKTKTEGENTFLEIVAEGNGQLINCNHQSNGALAPVVENAENYVVKFDVMIPEGWTATTGDIVCQLIFGGTWYWVGDMPIGDVVGKGKWVTWTIPMPADITGTLDMSSGSNGLSIEKSSKKWLPVGMRMDNFRLSLK